ncbi:MAG: translation initiation factor [DPANN group archaeon]|jgi:translation initiation factor 1|nr:translation initiation factor [DPANN group archaeon]
MSEICAICGLPKDICVCSDISKEGQKIIVKMDKRKYGSPTTVIEGLEAKDDEIKSVAKKLKEKLACGGTCKAKTIELQGDHRRKVKDLLVQLGFAADSIEVIQ